MKQIIIILILSGVYLAEAGVNNPMKLRGPEQYGVFFINQKPPEYVEDYYALYAERLYYSEDNAHLNIYFLEKGLKSYFRHPSKAFCLLKNQEQEKRYRYLIFMHMYVKIMQNYLFIASRYDKKDIYYFHQDIKEDLKKSLGYAKFYYNKAREYWQKVLAYAEKAGSVNESIPLDYLENELFLINNRDKEVDWDYDYTIQLHLNILEQNLKSLGD